MVYLELSTKLCLPCMLSDYRNLASQSSLDTSSVVTYLDRLARRSVNGVRVNRLFSHSILWYFHVKVVVIGVSSRNDCGLLRISRTRFSSIAKAYCIILPRAGPLVSCFSSLPHIYRRLGKSCQAKSLNWLIKILLA